MYENHNNFPYFINKQIDREKGPFAFKFYYICMYIVLHTYIYACTKSFVMILMQFNIPKLKRSIYKSQNI